MTRPDLAGTISFTRRLRRFLPARLAQADPFDVAAVLLLATLAGLIFLTFKDYAISNDEEVQQRYGELIITYYLSGFADQRLFHFQNLYLYGGLFDIIAVLLQHVLPFEAYDIRHVLCALIGIGGIGAAWATTRMIAGPRAAAIAAAVLAVCGPWYGPMFNHTKDIPFAAAMMGATYFLLHIARNLPRPRMRHIVFFGLLLGAALGIRVTGLLIVGYAGVAILMATPLPVGDWKKSLHFVARSLLDVAPAFLIGYGMMITAWPWAGIAPLNPIRAITAFAEFDYHIRTLMAGHIYEMGAVPRWYVPLYFLIKLPIVIMAGCLLAVAFSLRRAVSGASRPLDSLSRETAFVTFTVIFPLLCQVIGDGPAFTGIRHFLFIIPPLAVLAGIGIHQALTLLQARRPILAAGGFAMIAGALIWNAATLVRMHPYEYLFFNPLIGGLEGAARQFDTDYWVNIMPEAVDDLQAFLDRSGKASGARPAAHYSVAVCGERVSFEKEIDKDPRLAWTPDWKHADFFIAPTHMNCDRVLEGTVIATIERLGVPIGVVKDRRAITALMPADVPGPISKR
jgi:hypothetical protein